jgi:hypothetical protein
MFDHVHHMFAGPCKLDMTLYSEDVASDVMAAFYPVNSLRNRALAQAKTEVQTVSPYKSHKSQMWLF